ncbi:MAG TPA: hypothetical protein VFW59_04015 [Gallionella sp.]|nr:hypothetical protein [Gallionella sp.]
MPVIVYFPSSILRAVPACWLAFALWSFPCAASAASFSLSIADITSPEFSARGIVLTLPQDGSAELQIAGLRLQQRELHQVRLRCRQFKLSSAGMRCTGGAAQQLPGASLDFDYRFASQVWQFSAQLHRASAKALGALMAGMPQFTQGLLDGSVQASGEASGPNGFKADLRLTNINFGDDSGLHAAEKLSGTVRLEAARKAGVWNWRSDLVWQSGELFWQPLYLSGTGERRLSASGRLDGALFSVARGEAEVAQIGKMRFSALWDGGQGKLLEASAQGDKLELTRLFADYARPFFDKGVLSEALLSGRADVDWRYRNGATRALHLALRDASFGDSARRFSLRGVNMAFDWTPDALQRVNIVFGGGELFGMPLGAGQWPVQIRGFDVDVAQAELPVLDGKLALRDFRLRREGDDWRWQFGASLSRISMERFSQAVGWPKMLGTLAGRIPKVSYDGKEIAAEGALLFDVFDGSVVASGLKLVDPFGRAPRLYGNLNMRELDLDLLTRTFSFGNMLGRVDVDVNNLELQDWQPARFDARIASSAGKYPKRISQKAVQNISSLGGSGAMAAIQNSYLRFFESFGYDRIGWRCVLRNGVCMMGGVDDGNAGTYTIIKGGGIPAITVMGYNRAVSWDELISRLKRVTQGNMKAVVK